MDLQGMRDFVRAALDLDSTDLTDALLDVYIRQGERAALLAEKQWPFYESEGTFATAIGQRDYALATVLPTASTIRDLRCPDWQLEAVDRTRIDDLTGSTAPSGTPVMYARWGTTLRLYPTPSAVQTITATFYRNYVEFATASGNQPDCPRDFDEVIASYALSRAAIQQGDPESAAAALDAFNVGMTELKAFYMQTDADGPLVLGGRRGSGDIYRRNGIYISGSGWAG